MDHPRRGAVDRIDGEYLQTPEELDAYKQFSMCINCMLCYAACPVYGLDPDFVGPAAIALAERYDLDSRDQGARERLDVLIEHEGVWGCTFVGECTARVPQARRPGGRHPALQAEGRPGVGEGVPAAAGVPMTPRTQRATSPTGGRLDAGGGLRKRSYFVFVMRELSSIFVAWFVLYLLLFVRAVGRGRGGVRTTSSTGRRRPWLVALNVVAFAFLLLHTVTWFSAHAAGDGRAACAGAGCRRAAIIGAQYVGLAVVSAFVSWLV